VAMAAHRLEFDGFCYFMMEFESGPAIFSSMTRLLGHGSGTSLPEEPSLHEMLTRAKRALDGFAFVGFTEAFDRSVVRLQQRFGWHLESVRQINTAPGGTLPPGPAFMQWLERATRADNELYEYALERCSKMSSHGANILS
jgi:hypothetical protein